MSSVEDDTDAVFVIASDSEAIQAEAQSWIASSLFAPRNDAEFRYAAALTLPAFGTEEIVFSTCEAIWYGSPCEFGRRSSR